MIMAVVRPHMNYFYKQESYIKFELFDNLSSCLRQNDPEIKLCTFAHHLRYAFMVTGAELELPPYPADQLAKIRAFLEDTYRNPFRSITLSCDQMRQIVEANEKYRVYNCDNYRIVMRHITHPEERCGFINADLDTHEMESQILENVLALIPDAKPAE